MRGRQIGPQLKTPHQAILLPFRHFLVNNAAAGRHPLYIPGAYYAGIPHTVAMLYPTLEHISYSLNAPVRVPGKTPYIVPRIAGMEVIQEKEGVQQIRPVEAYGPSEMYPGPFQRGPAFVRLFYPSNFVHPVLR